MTEKIKVSPVTMLIAIAAVGVLSSTSANAQKFTALYSFLGQNDGSNVEAGVILRSGSLYGTTNTGGGSLDGGTIFKAKASTGNEQVIYSFGAHSDGYNPVAGLIYQSGTFYGTTFQGGTSGAGTVFKTNAAGHETVVSALPEAPTAATL